jgi:predicted HAD superfamily phosphohydrolase
MPEELKREEPMIDVGETEGAEIDLDSPKVVEEKEELDVVQEEQTASGEEQKEETEERIKKMNLVSIAKVLKNVLLN